MLATFLMYAVGIALACGLGVVAYRAWQNRDSDPLRNDALQRLGHDEEDEHATLHLPDDNLREVGRRQYGLMYPEDIQIEGHKRLLIIANHTDTEVWIGDPEGNFVAKGVGQVDERLLPGLYMVSFGPPGEFKYPVTLTEDVSYGEYDITVQQDL